jgi:mono/diheme cytochrome c family protein
MRTIRRVSAALFACVLTVVALHASRRKDHGGEGVPHAPAHLAETGLDASGARPFSPQYPLWSDGAVKRRWISLPSGSTIDASDDHGWQFPIGTRFWKEFTIGGRKVETRFIWRASESGWVFASYRWNEAQTDAVLASEDGELTSTEVAPGRLHAIPSSSDCRACHESTRGPGPLGFNALQLSTDRDPNAIHGEPLVPGMLTVRTLNEEGRFATPRPDLVNAPPRVDARSAMTRSVVGYLSANCGGCHNGVGDAPTLGASLNNADVRDGDAVLRAMAAHVTSWQRPGADGVTHLLDGGEPALSALIARMRSRRPSSQMPPLGTAIVDRDASEAIVRWIESDVRPLTAAPMSAACGSTCQ